MIVCKVGVDLLELDLERTLRIESFRQSPGWAECQGARGCAGREEEILLVPEPSKAARESSPGNPCPREMG